MKFAVPRDRFIAVATFLLNDTDISAGSQSFLLDMRQRARRGGPRISMSEGQFNWWMDLLSRHGRAIAEAETCGLMSVEGNV